MCSGAGRFFPSCSASLRSASRFSSPLPVSEQPRSRFFLLLRRRLITLAEIKTTRTYGQMLDPWPLVVLLAIELALLSFLSRRRDAGHHRSTDVDGMNRPAKVA